MEPVTTRSFNIWAGTDWVHRDQQQSSNLWHLSSILLNLSLSPGKAGGEVINLSAYLRWLRSGWSRSSECTAGNERAVSCRRDGHPMSNDK